MTGSSVLQGNKQHPHTEHEQYDEQVQKACPAIEQQFHNFAHPEYLSLNVSKTMPRYRASGKNIHQSTISSNTLAARMTAKCRTSEFCQMLSGTCVLIAR
jgi:hypothetical protein